MRRVSLVCCVLTLVAGCAHTPPVAPPNPSVACLGDVTRQPDTAAIAGRISFSDRPTLEMKADKSYSTEQQKPAIQAAESRYTSCVHLGDVWRRQYMLAAYEPVGMRYVSNVQADLLLLYEGKMTFGEYNTHVAALRADLDERLGNIRVAAMAEQDEFRRREAIARITAPPPPIFVPAVVQQPSTTNCTRFGNNVSCTTQ